MQAQTCGHAASTAQTGYQRRRPENGILHKIVREHVETLYAEAERNSEHGFGYPKYVKDEFEAFLKCGQMSEGFAKFRCKSCGHERLVAYSCKSRAMCPSCIAKRSALTAAHLVDSVLPSAPYRQWTVSFPQPLRLRLARDSALFSRCLTVALRTIFSWQRRKAKAAGLANVHTGSVTFAQLFGSLIQLTPHSHSWIADGVFVEREDGTLTFHRLGPPTDKELAQLCARIRTRVLRLFDPDGDDVPDDDDVTIASVQAAAIDAPLNRPLWFEEGDAQTRTPAPLSAFNAGFSLHAGVEIRQNDRRSLERVLRYGSRPPLAQKRLSLLPSGKVRLKLRKPTHSGQTEIVLEPLAFLRRLAAILPKPRFHLTRFHGIYSGRHARRRALRALLPQARPSMPAVADAADAGAEGVDAQISLPPNKRYPYTVLLSRVFKEDLGACEKCGGKMRFVACIDDKKVIHRILSHLGLPTDLPQKAPARAPPQMDFGDWDLTPDDDGAESWGN